MNALDYGVNFDSKRINVLQFKWEDTLYEIDQHIARVAKELFIAIQHNSDKNKLDWPIELTSLTSSRLKNIIYFCKYGSMPPCLTKKELREIKHLSKAYHFDLLTEYIRAQGEEDKLSDGSKLKLAAMKQDIKEFMRIFSDGDIWPRAVKVAICYFSFENYSILMTRHLDRFARVSYPLMEAYYKGLSEKEIESILQQTEDVYFKVDLINFLSDLSAKVKWIKTIDERNIKISLVREHLIKACIRKLKFEKIVKSFEELGDVYCWLELIKNINENLRQPYKTDYLNHLLQHSDQHLKQAFRLSAFPINKTPIIKKTPLENKELEKKIKKFIKIYIYLYFFCSEENLSHRLPHSSPDSKICGYIQNLIKREKSKKAKRSLFEQLTDGFEKGCNYKIDTQMLLFAIYAYIECHVMKENVICQRILDPYKLPLTQGDIKTSDMQILNNLRPRLEMRLREDFPINLVKDLLKEQVKILSGPYLLREMILAAIKLAKPREIKIG